MPKIPEEFSHKTRPHGNENENEYDPAKAERAASLLLGSRPGRHSLPLIALGIGIGIGIAEPRSWSNLGVIILVVSLLVSSAIAAVGIILVLWRKLFLNRRLVF